MLWLNAILIWGFAAFMPGMLVIVALCFAELIAVTLGGTDPSELLPVA
ncbi:MAG: hypothetical protein AAGJ96_02005 [Pseudomonadota bacterium]